MSEKVKLTACQKRAVECKGAILVSASAGSGKTKVMIDRILEYLKGGGHLRRVLALTFNRANAAEMKERLIDKMREAIRDREPCAEHFRSELKDAPFALICTIDSFCYDIYNRYFEKIGGEAGLAIMEPEESDLIFNSVCQDVAEDAIKSGNKAFKELLGCFRQGRGYENYFVAMRELRDFFAVRVDEKGFLEKADQIVAMKAEERPSVAYFCAHYRQRAAKLQDVLERLMKRKKELESDRQSFPEVLNKCVESRYAFVESLSRLESLNEIISYVHTHHLEGQLRGPAAGKYSTEIIDLFAGFKTPCTYAKELYDEIKEMANIKEYGERAYDVLMKGEENNGKYNQTFLETFKMIMERYERAKKEDSKADFADMEKWALKILEIPDVREEVAKQIDEIFLDEYQDTNYLQEKIITSVAKKNTFMVGDVKQSIYMFRHAEPKLFDDRFRRYQANAEDGTNILLNDNFRSAKGILDFVNLIFAKLMTYDFGKVNYKEEAMLSYPKDENGNEKEDYGIDEDVPRVSVAEFVTQSELVTFPKDYDIKDANMAKSDMSEEAVYVANKIKSLVGTHKVYDPDLKIMRPIRFKDIAVLVRKRKSAEGFIKAFKAAGIPYSAGSFSNEEESADVDILISLLRVVDNARQDIPLVAVMRSPLGGFSEEKLVEIRRFNRSLPFAEAVLAYAQCDEQTRDFVTKLRKWAVLSHTMTVAELLSVIIAETGYDAYLISTGAPERITAVNTFIGTLRGKDFAADLCKLLAYLDGGGVIETLIPPSGEDAVVFNTMHGSKGLQYLIVFVVDLDAKTPQDRRKVYADEDFGLAVLLSGGNDSQGEDSEEGEDFDEEVYSTKDAITIKAQKKNTKFKENTEALRLAYVALTRARCHLFLTYTISASKSIKLAPNPETVGKLSDWLRFIKDVGDEDASKLQGYYERSDDIMEIGEPKPREMNIPKSGFEINLNIPYPYKNAVEASTKLSVSRMNRAREEVEDYKHVFKHSGTVSAEMGTLYHEILENIDFNVSNYEELRECVKKLGEEGKISEAARQIDLSVFEKSPDNYVFKTARGSDLLREQPFMLYLPADEAGIENCSDKVLVQGVIDLFIFDKDKCSGTLVDYKFTNAGEKIVKERYTLQLETYAMAIKKLLNLTSVKKLIYVVNQNLVINI